MDVAKPSIDLAQVMQLAMFNKNVLFNSLDLGIFPRQELNQVEETGLVLGLVVVAVLDLALEGGKLDGLLAGTGVGPVNNGVLGLDGEKTGEEGRRRGGGGGEQRNKGRE